MNLAPGAKHSIFAAKGSFDGMDENHVVYVGYVDSGSILINFIIMA